MSVEQFLGVAPWMMVAGIATWIGAAWKYSDERQARKLAREDEKKAREEAKAVEMAKHRDDLALKLLAAAREEVAVGRAELDHVREENRALRSIEQHFYHYQQAIDHLEAVLAARDDPNAYAVAERNAMAFLARVKRVEQAKGDIQQAAQIIESAARLEERDKK